MKTIVNKTLEPLRIPLPRGKVLHLGPRKSARITPQAVDHPPLLRLVEAGSVEIRDEAWRGGTGGQAPEPLTEATEGHPPGTLERRGEG